MTTKPDSTVYLAGRIEGKVDGNVIRGVKIVGFKSESHKRRYHADALQASVAAYENAKVRFNHVTKPGEVPRAESAFGRIKNVVFEAARGLVGDLHIIAGHPWQSAVAWAAENDPEQYCLSHYADLRGKFASDGWLDVHRVEKVHSVDVVSSGGTTSGLFESARQEDKMELSSMTVPQLQAARQDIKVLTISEHAAVESEKTKLRERIVALEAENTELKGKVDGFEAAAKLDERNAARVKVVEAAKLPDHLNTDTFKELVLDPNTSDEAFAKLLEERKGLNTPTSRQRGVKESAGSGIPTTKSYKDFAETLKAGGF